MRVFVEKYEDAKMLSAENFHAIPVYLLDFTSIFVHKKVS